MCPYSFDSNVLECEAENENTPRVTSTNSAAGICPCSYKGITSVDNSTRNASVQFKYNNGSVETKSFVLNKSGLSEFSLNILPCYIYYVRVMPLFFTLLIIAIFICTFKLLSFALCVVLRYQFLCYYLSRYSVRHCR